MLLVRFKRLLQASLLLTLHVSKPERRSLTAFSFFELFQKFICSYWFLPSLRLRSFCTSFTLCVTSSPFVSCSSFLRLSRSSRTSGLGRCPCICLFWRVSPL